MLSIHKLIEEVDHLTAAEKLQLVKHMLEALEQEKTTSPLASDYQEFLRETYGVLRDTPIERWEQGGYEEREPLIAV